MTPKVIPVLTTPRVIPVLTTPKVIPVLTTPKVIPVLITPKVIPVLTTPKVIPVLTTPKVIPVTAKATAVTQVITPIAAALIQAQLTRDTEKDTDMAESTFVVAGMVVRMDTTSTKITKGYGFRMRTRTFVK